VFDNLREDLLHYKRYCYPKLALGLVLVRALYAHPASAAVVWYRFGRAAYGLKIPVLREVLKVIYLLFLPGVRMYSGVQLLPATEIGPGLAILHFGGVVIAPKTKIGRNCLLHHNCSMVTMRSAKGATIGDNFYAGAGAILIGTLTVEDNVTAGAGCVITKSVPRDAVVAGVPAKIIRFRREQEQPTENKTLPLGPPVWMESPPGSQPPAMSNAAENKDVPKVS
jgi:serine O-acetyltransferase